MLGISCSCCYRCRLSFACLPARLLITVALHFPTVIVFQARLRTLFPSVQLFSPFVRFVVYSQYALSLDRSVNCLFGCGYVFYV